MAENRDRGQHQWRQWCCLTWGQTCLVLFSNPYNTRRKLSYCSPQYTITSTKNPIKYKEWGFEVHLRIVRNPSAATQDGTHFGLRSKWIIEVKVRNAVALISWRWNFCYNNEIFKKWIKKQTMRLSSLSSRVSTNSSMSPLYSKVLTFSCIAFE